MGFFNWAAPLFNHFADRWDDAGIEQIAGWLRPYLPPDRDGDHRILDVGGGTGALAAHLHRVLGASVTVLDPTPEMLRYIPREGPVRGVLGSAEDAPFDDDEFDVVIVTDAFHHFRDQTGAVREFRRIVRDGGGVVVVDLDPRPPRMRLIAWVERRLGEPGAFLTPPQMCSFMRTNGIDGDCEPFGDGPEYRFVGTVRA